MIAAAAAARQYSKKISQCKQNGLCRAKRINPMRIVNTNLNKNWIFYTLNVAHSFIQHRSQCIWLSFFMAGLDDAGNQPTNSTKPDLNLFIFVCCMLKLYAIGNFLISDCQALARWKWPTENICSSFDCISFIFFWNF